MRIATATLFAAGLAALPLSTAKAQYCTPFPLSWPFCIAGAAINTAATIVTAPFYAISRSSYYYGSPYYYNGARHYHRYSYSYSNHHHRNPHYYRATNNRQNSTTEPRSSTAIEQTRPPVSQISEQSA